jgi:membrane-associated phospholipid phosphatase
MMNFDTTIIKDRFNMRRRNLLMPQLILQVFIIFIILFHNSIKAQDYKYFQDSDLFSTPNQTLSKLFSKDSLNDYSPYELVRNREILILGSGAILGITGLVFINNIQPLTLEEIDQLDPVDINKFDRQTVGKYRDYLAGDLILYGSFLLPLTFLSNKEMKRDIKILTVMGLEVLMFQAGLNAVVKGVTQRTRPYVYDPNSASDKKTSKDGKLSFYSGHTSTTAAMSFYTAKVFSDYLPNGLTKSLIWTGAIVYPALAGYLRVTSANHFLTDVMVGYSIGALVGYYMPQLHYRDGEEGLSIFPSLKYNNFTLSVRYSF